MAHDPMDFFARKEPQSILKHQVFERYLRAWAKIVANRFPYLSYVDGFAGPGYYSSGEECSPAIAARVLSEVRAKSRKPPTARCWHVEKNPEVYARLLEDLKKIPADVTVRPYLGEFHEHLPGILRDVQPTRSPAFFFIDPFGFSVDYDDLVRINAALKDSRRRTHGEILVNYATSSIQQWLTAPNAQDRLDHFFGTRAWRDVYKAHGTAERPLLSLYEAQLRKHWSYVLSVAIPKPNMARTYFHLVFASDTEVAVRIMKEVMHKAKDQGWRQLSLFEEQDFEAYKEWIHDQFRRQTVEGKAVIARALEQHPNQEKDADRAIRQLVEEGVVFPHRNGKKDVWDWMLMFDLDA